MVKRAQVIARVKKKVIEATGAKPGRVAELPPKFQKQIKEDSSAINQVILQLREDGCLFVKKDQVGTRLAFKGDLKREPLTKKHAAILDACRFDPEKKAYMKPTLTELSQRTGLSTGSVNTLIFSLKTAGFKFADEGPFPKHLHDRMGRQASARGKLVQLIERNPHAQPETINEQTFKKTKKHLETLFHKSDAKTRVLIGQELTEFLHGSPSAQKKIADKHRSTLEES